MRRRAHREDPMAAVPEDLREFRVDDWLPFVGNDDEQRPELAAVRRCVDARRQWVAEHGYPAGDPIPWLQQDIHTRRDVVARAYNTERTDR